jgi:Putative transposase of IS4/5 family (DUF4096)
MPGEASRPTRNGCRDARERVPSLRPRSRTSNQFFRPIPAADSQRTLRLQTFLRSLGAISSDFLRRCAPPSGRTAPVPELAVLFQPRSSKDAKSVQIFCCQLANGPPSKPVRSIEHGRRPAIQIPKMGSRIMRHELADHEWGATKPMLPDKPRGVPRVNDRRVLNGIFRVLRSGAPWRDLPEAFGPYTASERDMFDKGPAMPNARQGQLL